MKTKLKHIYNGLNNAMCTSVTFLGGVSFIIYAFFADKTWQGILAFIGGILLTFAGVCSAYIDGENAARLKEFEKKELESLKWNHTGYPIGKITSVSLVENGGISIGCELKEKMHINGEEDKS